MQDTAPKYGGSKQHISISQFHGWIVFGGYFSCNLSYSCQQMVSRLASWEAQPGCAFGWWLFPSWMWVLTGVAGNVDHWPGKPLAMHIYEIRRHDLINFRLSLFVKPLLVLFTKNQHFLDSGEILGTLKINILQMSKQCKAKVLA